MCCTAETNAQYPPIKHALAVSQTELTGLKLAALESNKSLDLEKKEGRIDDLLRVGAAAGVPPSSARRSPSTRLSVTELNLLPARPTVTCGGR